MLFNERIRSCNAPRPPPQQGVRLNTLRAPLTRSPQDGAGSDRRPGDASVAYNPEAQAEGPGGKAPAGLVRCLSLCRAGFVRRPSGVISHRPPSLFRGGAAHTYGFDDPKYTELSLYSYKVVREPHGRNGYAWNLFEGRLGLWLQKDIVHLVNSLHWQL